MSFSKKEDAVSIIKNVKDNNRLGGTAPIENDFNFNMENSEDYISTINYYIYYTSNKELDPSLPKPTYLPQQDFDFMTNNKTDKDNNTDHEDDLGELGGNLHTILNDDDKLSNSIKEGTKDLTITIPENEDDNKPNTNINNDPNIYDDPLHSNYTQYSYSAPNSPYPLYPGNVIPLPMNIHNIQMFNIYMNNPHFHSDHIYNNISYPSSKHPNASNTQSYYPRNNRNSKHKSNKNITKQKSHLLYHNNSNNIYIKNHLHTFDEVYNALPDICKEHPGSKIFQNVYDDSSPEQKQKIIEKLLPETYSLSKDVFGNYVIQRLIEIESIPNKKLFISQLHSNIKELTLHMYGCRVIQKAIEYADIEDVRQHLHELQNDLIKCIQDQNGNHVIQKLIEKLPKGEHTPLITIIQGRVYQLSINQYGCRVIQRIFEHCVHSERESILNEIYERIHELCMDQYGNYVIQNIVEKMESRKVFDNLKGKLYEYSKHKFASNVVEKCLCLGKKEHIDNIVNEIIELDNKQGDVLYTLVNDKYGNYVVQKMIDVANAKSKEILVKKIVNGQSLKKRDGYSKHVLNMIEKNGLSSHIA